MSHFLRRGRDPRGETLRSKLRALGLRRREIDGFIQAFYAPGEVITIPGLSRARMNRVSPLAWQVVPGLGTFRGLPGREPEARGLRPYFLTVWYEREVHDRKPANLKV